MKDLKNYSYMANWGRRIWSTVDIALDVLIL